MFTRLATTMCVLAVLGGAHSTRNLRGGEHDTGRTQHGSWKFGPFDITGEKTVHCDYGAAYEQCGHGRCALASSASNSGVCMCDVGFASASLAAPCEYRRKNQVIMFIVQLLVGWVIPLAQFLLGWNGFAVTCLALLILPTLMSLCSVAGLMSNDPGVQCGATIFALCMQCAQFIGCILMIVFWVVGLVWIADPSTCVDGNGIQCNINM